MNQLFANFEETNFSYGKKKIQKTKLNRRMKLLEILLSVAKTKFILQFQTM